MSLLTLEEYIAYEAIHFSTLKYIDKSPADYKWAIEVGRTDTTALLKFRAVHTAVMEPDVFDERYVVFPGKKRQGKDWDKFAEEHKDHEIIKADEKQVILNMADKVHEHPLASQIFEEGEAERAIVWTHKRTGLKMKCRLDWWSKHVLVDLKNGPVQERLFGAIAAKLKYHVQIAMYDEALYVETGERPPKKFVVVDPTPPHHVAVVPVDEEQLRVGRECFEGWLDAVVECRNSGHWPGPYDDTEMPLVLPNYVYADDSIEDGTHQIVEGGEEDVG
jgi:hypothetical protein